MRSADRGLRGRLGLGGSWCRPHDEHVTARGASIEGDAVGLHQVLTVIAAAASRALVGRCQWLGLIDRRVPGSSHCALPPAASTRCPTSRSADGLKTANGFPAPSRTVARDARGANPPAINSDMTPCARVNGSGADE